MTDQRPRPYQRPNRSGRCGATAPGFADVVLGPCVLDAGHGGRHIGDAGAEWSETPTGLDAVTGGLVVNPGDTLVLILPDDFDADAEMVDAMTAHLRERLPAGAQVVYAQGVTPVVVRADPRCRETTRAGYPEQEIRCRHDAGHDGAHHASWATGTVGWGS